MSRLAGAIPDIKIAFDITDKECHLTAKVLCRKSYIWYLRYPCLLVILFFFFLNGETSLTVS